MMQLIIKIETSSLYHSLCLSRTWNKLKKINYNSYLWIFPSFYRSLNLNSTPLNDSTQSTVQPSLAQFNSARELSVSSANIQCRKLVYNMIILIRLWLCVAFFAQELIYWSQLILSYFYEN